MGDQVMNARSEFKITDLGEHGVSVVVDGLCVTFPSMVAATEWIDQFSTKGVVTIVREPAQISTVDDVTADVINTATLEVFLTYFDHDEPIDWEYFWDRLEQFGWSITEMDSPAAKKIQRAVRTFKGML